MPISDELKQVIRERAQYICEYCYSPEQLSANRFTINHILREQHQSVEQPVFALS